MSSDGTHLPVLPDLAARIAALTSVERSLLVEAGAGSGKTSIMAGRVAVLLSRGVEPKHVAAITFTEFAASELQIRVHRFVQMLANSNVPSELTCAFPGGVSDEQRENLTQALATLDQLTCSTIHGFAQALIKPYPVEAAIDPGADIIDPAEGDLAFAERFDAWLKEELSDERQDGMVAQLILADEGAGLALVREVAAFRRANRDARPGDGAWNAVAIDAFGGAVASFRDALARLAYRETTTDECLEAFTSIDAAMNTLDLRQHRPSPAALTGVLQLGRPKACFTQGGGLRALQAKGRWSAAATAAGASKTDGERSFAIASACYDACHRAYSAMRTAAAGEVLACLSSSMDELMAQWHRYKRAAALLDFDDLLYTARDLLAQHELVRQALAKRYLHVLVDEFQDTDPLQTEILWWLCGETPVNGAVSPLARQLRAGALFLVGDPKQAVYRFRGADVNAYVAARESMGAQALLQVTANFRSVKPILDFVNARFAVPLSQAHGQPGFTALAATRNEPGNTVAVAALDVRTESDKPSSEMLRDAEAARVAALCRRMIGAVTVRDPETQVVRPCEAGDIALLAPVGTDLWRFEEALEEQGIAVSTQAGKGFFWRQEIQDLIALTRSLADTHDTLALGALLRGPLVGLSEMELLDIADALPVDPERADRLPQLSLWTNLQHLDNPLACSVLQALQELGRRVRSTTPFILLADAIETLKVRPQLRQRLGTGAERALANVDLFLEMARAYDVRGIRAFARDMRANWEEAVRQVEGRPDAQQQAVALITVHAAKGLEWPIVIPINMTGTPREEGRIVYDRRRARFSTRVLGVEPGGYANLKTLNEQEQERERVRLWYVASTRARDFLILPRHAAVLPDRSWARLVDLDLDSLPAFDSERVPEMPAVQAAAVENEQSPEVFAAEVERIARATRKLTWLRPSRDEADKVDAEGEVESAEDPPIFRDHEMVDERAATVLDVVGSATRGTILHKLMEEVLTGETSDDVGSLTTRGAELLAHLGGDPAAGNQRSIVPEELAATIVRTLNLPQIAELRPRLLPEFRVYGSEISTNGETLTSGIADAVAFSTDATIDVVIDWKSDVDSNAARMGGYGGQLAAYRKVTGASRALLVMMTVGKVIELTGE